MKTGDQKLYLILLSFVAALGGFLFGFDTAVISGTVTLVREQFSMNTMTEGWFVSSALLGCIIGVAFAGKLSDSFGRKKVMLISGLLFFISGIGCAWAGSQNSLIFYRWLGGVGVGVASIVSPLYLSEFAPARLRGRMVAIYQLAITLGILLAYFSNVWILGLSSSEVFEEAWLHFLVNEQVWRAMLGMNALPSALFLLLLFFVPESPRWLISKNKSAQAKDLLERINGKEQAEKEIQSIQSAAGQEPGEFKAENSGTGWFCAQRSAWRSGDNRNSECRFHICSYPYCRSLGAQASLNAWSRRSFSCARRGRHIFLYELDIRAMDTLGDRCLYRLLRVFIRPCLLDYCR